MKQVIPGLWVIEEIGNAVHCYLWRWSRGATLIDCGLPRDGDKILRALVNNGHPVHTIDRIIVTHVDMDHTGGLPTVKRATGADVVCHENEREFMENPTRRKMGSVLMDASLVVTRILPGFRQETIHPEGVVADGEILPEGFRVIHTPGHTPGHMSLLHREARLLIAGDALANRRGKLSGPPALFTPDMPAAERSILKLAKQYGDDYETIVFGHGPPILANGGKRVRALASQIFAGEI